MIREMTLGQYYKADSILHKLDPRVKLLGTLLFVITLFFPKSLLSLGIATAFLILIVKLSKVPVSMMIRGVKPLFIIICFSAIINMISVSGDMLVKIGPITIAKQGLWMAFYLVVRLVYLVIGSSVMTFTTTPNQLTDGLEKGFYFLKKVLFLSRNFLREERHFFIYTFFLIVFILQVSVYHPLLFQRLPPLINSDD